AQEGDVLRREVKSRHAVAAAPEANQVRARAAGDVEDRADRATGIASEAVGEKIHLLLAVHVEGDLVVARRGILGVGHSISRSSTWPSHVDRGRNWLEPSRGSGTFRHARSHLPHHVRIASRRIQEAVMPVRPDGSKTWATSIRSVPTIRQGARSRTISTSSAAVMPQGSGAPVPGASDG